MKRLTKLERFTAYCIMLEEAELGNGYFIDEDGEKWNYASCGFCWMVLQLFDSQGCYDSPENLFPELYKKSQSCDDFYFENWGHRIAALKRCIIETHP